MKRPLSVRQAQSFDKFAQEKLGVPSIILMENAGRSVAEEARGAKTVAVVCGTGNNGGDGFVAARHLLNSGTKVSLCLVGPRAKLKPDAKANLNILLKMGIKIKKTLAGLAKHDLIIDALFGIGLNSPVTGPYRAAIEAINDSGVPVLAVDVPSGLDADTGKVLGVAVRAKKTVTFAAPKQGFFKADGPAYCGRIIIRDIGVARR